MSGLLHFCARALRKAASLIDPRSGQPIDISDEFVTWLCFANAGMLHRGNLHCIAHAMRNLPSAAPIFEIGAFCGLSTNLLCYYKRLQGSRNKVINCDPWEFERSGESAGPFVPNSTVRFEAYREFVRSTYLRNVEMFSHDDLPFTVEDTSDRFFEAWRRKETRKDVFGREIQLGGAISFCYVDGNHSYEFAKRDFQNCNEFLEPGGFLLFDDSAEGLGFEGVTRVAREAIATQGYGVEMKNPNYLLRKRS
ncbi:MAG: class I SAM-dependent methyltransferase [Acidobacteria bacterium]|nr:class I SAM-dependent methyltransferase [Acidobacteriota bacterium]